MSFLFSFRYCRTTAYNVTRLIQDPSCNSMQEILPGHREEVLTVVMTACDGVSQADVYDLVMNCMEQIYGLAHGRHAIAGKRLPHGLTAHGEAVDFVHGTSFYARIPARQRRAGHIRAVIAGTVQQRKHLEGILDLLARMGVIKYVSTTLDEIEEGR